MSDHIPPVSSFNNSTADSYINLNHESRISRLEEKLNNTNQRIKEDYQRANISFKELSVKIDRLNDKISKLEVSKVKLISFIGGISATVCLLTSFIGWIVSIIFK